MINLPNFKILDMKESTHDYRFLVESTTLSPSHCPKCGTVANLYKHGKKQQLFFDLPMHAKRVGIYVNRQRYKCRECNETFFEDLPDMDVNRSVTNRLINWIQETSLEKTFTSVAEEIGVDEKTVRNIFNDYVAELEAQTDFRTPKWLGIDEVHLLKNYRCVITDVENKSVIDILRKRNKDVVISYLSRLQDIDKIELVAMDMWNPYKSAVNSVIPHAKIVIDKFHVVKLANEALEKIRKANRQNVSAKERRQLMRDRYVLLTRRKDLNDFDDQIKLQIWTDMFPLLGQAYELKEQFFDIYEAKSINEAYKLYQNWFSNVPNELMAYFEDLIKAMNNWEEEIWACGQNLRPKLVRRKMMFTYKDRVKAIKLYLKYESYAAVINELGYPSRGALRQWVEEYKGHGDIKKEITRRSKYTDKEKHQAVHHYLEFGKCYSRTCRMLGYPSRALLTKWVKELAPQARKFKRNGLKLTSEEKEAAVFALLTRGDTSAQNIADKVGVSRESLYKYKDQLLGKDVSINKMKKPNDIDANKLKDQVKQLQEEVFHLQMQKDILEKAGEIIKKDQGIFLETLTNKEKTILIDALRPKYRLSQLLSIIDIPKSSYCYHKRQLALPDKYKDVRAKIIDIFERNKRRYGYRRIHASLKNNGMVLSEKVVRRIMREENLIAKSIKMRKYNSYHGELSPAVPNILQRDFKADKSNEKWVTDITEFSIPAGKVYLSPIVDCFDGAVVSWTINTSPNAELVNTMLDQAVFILQKDEQPILHTDRGAHYRWQGWIDRMDNHQLIRSMSKKGCSPDNAACEGFFGRLKNEFFYGESWIDVSVEDFIEQLDGYLEWYNHKRIKLSLGGVSIMKYRKSMNFVA